MTNATIDITIQFREGADVQDEAYRFRKVFADHNIEISDERYTKDSVTYTVECTIDSFGFVTSLIENKNYDVDEAVVNISYKQDQSRIPVMGTVRA